MISFHLALDGGTLRTRARSFFFSASYSLSQVARPADRDWALGDYLRRRRFTSFSLSSFFACFLRDLARRLFYFFSRTLFCFCFFFSPRGLHNTSQEAVDARELDELTGLTIQ